MPDVQQERRSADARAVHPARDDAERVGDLDRSWRADRRDPVDVLQREAGVSDRVERGLGMQLERGVIRKLAELVGFGCSGDNDVGHGAVSAAVAAGVKSGRLRSPRRVKVTRSGMSSTRSSGVFGTPMRLAIIRGPSASWTTAIA